MPFFTVAIHHASGNLKNAIKTADNLSRMIQFYLAVHPKVYTYKWLKVKSPLKVIPKAEFYVPSKFS